MTGEQFRRRLRHQPILFLLEGVFSQAIFSFSILQRAVRIQTQSAVVAAMHPTNSLAMLHLPLITKKIIMKSISLISYITHIKYSKRILVIFEYKMRSDSGFFDLPEMRENARKNTIFTKKHTVNLKEQETPLRKLYFSFYVF